MEKHITLLALIATLAFSKVTVIHPNSLKDMTTNGIIPSSLGNFGHIQYGSTIVNYIILNILRADG
jgi:hypothetical protein